MFVKINQKLVNSKHLREIDCSRLESHVEVDVYYFYEQKPDTIAGQPAVDLLMQLNPSIIEGKRLKFIRHAWAFHNLFAHPVLQILSWARLTKLGMKVHDKTVPRPKGTLPRKGRDS